MESYGNYDYANKQFDGSYFLHCVRKGALWTRRAGGADLPARAPDPSPRRLVATVLHDPKSIFLNNIMKYEAIRPYKGTIEKECHHKQAYNDTLIVQASTRCHNLLGYRRYRPFTTDKAQRRLRHGVYSPGRHRAAQ
ncbi:hypothetical protein EVAR_17259_1 [Eumeta japonica]|uniref:Uncharacterized protein n=1 Tax=Eumeta variegata TaxID=151549 RepID=A0A4C1TSZ1_EUMVA|nr:hypothetical protein EVAR_17259_1 [Eumeta japonica]